MISSGIRNDKKSGLPEGGLNLIGKCTGSESSGNRGGANIKGELQTRTLGKRSEKVSIVSDFMLCH